MLIRNYDDQGRVKEGLSMVMYARAIYASCGRPRESAYAAVFQAEAFLKLGMFSEAWSAVGYARPLLEPDMDKDVLAHCCSLEERLLLDGLQRKVGER